MLHMGYVDEALFGSEVLDGVPALVGEWVRAARKNETDQKPELRNERLKPVLRERVVLRTNPPTVVVTRRGARLRPLRLLLRRNEIMAVALEHFRAEIAAAEKHRAPVDAEAARSNMGNATI